MSIENKLTTIAENQQKVYDAGFAAGQQTGGGGAEGCATVTFMNGDTVLLTRPVYIGDDCPDPVAQSRIETPTKESTPQYNYTYSGWSLTNGGSADTTNALANVTEDRTVYAAYTESVRYYTVSFYDGDTLLKTEQVAYGGSSIYTYDKENYVFSGWTPEPTNITSDMSCYGVWEESYTFADASWEYISRMSESGKASEVFTVGDTKTIQITAKDGNKINTDVQIIGFNHDDLSDGLGKAGISIAFVSALSHDIFADKSAGFWSGDAFGYTSEIRETLNSLVYSSLPEDMKEHVKSVTKTTSSAYDSTNSVYTYETSNGKIWYMAACEMATSAHSSYSGRLTFPNGEGSLYEYFTDRNNCIKTGLSITGTSDSNIYVKTRTTGKYSTTLTRVAVQNGYVILPGGNYFGIGFCI